MIRITADLDNTPLSVAKIRTQSIINWLFYNKNIIFDNKTIRLSSSKKGCHVILWSPNLLNKEEIFFIRYLLGDDVKRIQRDRKSKRPHQHLFYKKKFLNDNDREKILLKLRGFT